MTDISDYPSAWGVTRTKVRGAFATRSRKEIPEGWSVADMMLYAAVEDFIAKASSGIFSSAIDHRRLWITPEENLSEQMLKLLEKRLNERGDCAYCRGGTGHTVTDSGSSDGGGNLFTIHHVNNARLDGRTSYRVHPHDPVSFSISRGND